MPETDTPPRMPSFGEALETWALVAVHGFGGPAEQVGAMHRVWVEERRWLSEERFLHALSTVTLLPGPETTQLAAYVGWLSHGVRGGLCAGLVVVLPGFLGVLALSAAYVVFHEVVPVRAALAGLQAAMLAAVVDALLRIGRRVLDRPATVAVAVAAFLALFALRVPLPVVIAGAGLLGAVARPAFPPPAPPAPRPPGVARPLLDELLDAGRLPHTAPRPARDLRIAAVLVALWLAPPVALAAGVGLDATFTRVAGLFSAAAAVALGGPYTVVAFVAQRAVEVHGWLTPAELLQGLGMVEAAPGPQVQVVQHVAFLAAFRDPAGLPPVGAGALGAALAAWATFVPCLVFPVAGGPYLDRIRRSAALASALRAITAAVVGAIASLALWFAVHGARRPPAIAVGLVAAAALIGLRWPKLPVLTVAAAAGAAIGWGLGW